MRLKERYKRDLKKAIEELTASFTLYHLWQEWDAKEHSRISNTEE